MKNFGFQWHITNYCNLRCFHCYQDDFSRNGESTFEEMKSVILKISTVLREKTITINFTGGEPLLYGNIFELLNFAENTGNIKSFNLITNGLLLNTETIDRLKCFKKLKEIKISLDGGDAETNDRIRGRGVFDRVLMNIERLREVGGKEIILMYTLGSYNYLNLAGMVNFAKNLGIDGVIIERFIPWGRGLLLKEQYLKKDEWLSVINDIIRLTNIDCSPGELLPYKAFHIIFKRPVELKGALCNLGDESMALMPNGDVYPCRRFPTRIGNILTDDFNEILLRLRILKNNILENLKGKCRDCEVENCFGCRALSYAINNDFYAPDPQCFL
ncbi:MAG: radical SAM protein [candidate division WOR-3 bacterium]|nr:radical SAM protein [candidate division WOR-3 bacterium]